MHLFYILALMVLLVLLVRETITLIWLLAKFAFELVRFAFYVTAILVVAVCLGFQWLHRVLHRPKHQCKVEILPPARVTRY
jgi:hypothetical protein